MSGENKEVKTKEEKKPFRSGWKFIVFFLPPLGLIFFCLWEDDKHEKAMECLKMTLWGLVFMVLFSVGFWLLCHFDIINFNLWKLLGLK